MMQIGFVLIEGCEIGDTDRDAQKYAWTNLAMVGPVEQVEGLPEKVASNIKGTDGFHHENDDIRN